MAVREKLLINLVVRATCPTHARTNVTAGPHEIVIDEPVSNGGTDLAPTPLQTLVASLLGCTNVILNKLAARDGVSIHGLDVKADAVLDRRGTTLQEEVAVPFPKIDLTIALRLMPGLTASTGSRQILAGSARSQRSFGNPAPGSRKPGK